MTLQVIDAERLKTVRKARKIGRSKLAKLSGLTERQVSRLEGATSGGVGLSDAVVGRLSDALQIPQLVLTGQLALTDDDLQPVAKPTCTSGCCS